MLHCYGRFHLPCFTDSKSRPDRKLVSRFLIFPRRTRKAEANSEIHYWAERSLAGLLPLRRLVTVLQDPARRTGTKSAGNPEAGSRRRGHQLRFNRRAQELRRPATYHLSAPLRPRIEDHTCLRHPERNRQAGHAHLRHPVSWCVHHRPAGQSCREVL